MYTKHLRDRIVLQFSLKTASKYAYKNNSCKELKKKTFPHWPKLSVLAKTECFHKFSICARTVRDYICRQYISI